MSKCTREALKGFCCSQAYKYNARFRAPSNLKTASLTDASITRAGHASSSHSWWVGNSIFRRSAYRERLIGSTLKALLLVLVGHEIQKIIDDVLALKPTQAKVMRSQQISYSYGTKF